jgi:YD repeat-containing protein
MIPVEEYYYGKSGLDSSKISLMDGDVETSVYERGTPLNIISSIRTSSPDGYGKIKFDQEGKKIEDKRFRQNAGMISITDYIYDYKGNNIAINLSDGEYHLKYRTENTFDDDNNLVFTKNTDGQTKYKYNNLKQKTEEISYQGDGRVKRKTFFEYNIDGSIARIISNDMERSFFITYNRFGQETENYFSESNGPITKVVTMHAGKFITGKKTIFQERVLSDTSYKYDAKKRVIEQTTYFEGSQIGDLEKTINRYDTGCPIPNQTLIYWGERLYSKTTFELTPACKIKSRKVSQPSGLYIVANDDPTPRGIDSYKPIYDLKKRLIEETYTNTLKGIIYHIKIKYLKDKIRQVTLNDMTLNFDENNQLTFTTLNGKVKDRYSYKYDKQANWILMEVKENIFMTHADDKTMKLMETKSRFTKREITYY